jgi:hypothetical protein
VLTAAVATWHRHGRFVAPNNELTMEK